ncbi:hypothetical protein EYC84_003761 [Monilinia fructicola]|uniref:Uncharacterized protein n=1 Tax=Monilinia fructicola TaxID=38448 RepID=A0A5M9JYP1_MONFR|nr:hypothetical protein EYC84_003761 [Monilinia fructicola]
MGKEEHLVEGQEEVDGLKEKTGEIDSKVTQGDFAKSSSEDRPTWTRMHLRHLSIEVLKDHKIDYVIDEHISSGLQTRALRTRQKSAQRDRDFPSQSRVNFERASSPGIVEVRRANAAELKLDINRIDMKEWRGVKYMEQRGKHVLDVAVEEGRAVRVAINSEALRDELRIILGAGVGLEIGQERNVLIGPWKVLVEYEEAIRKRLQKLEEMMRFRDENPVEEGDNESHHVDKVPLGNREALTRPPPVSCQVCDIVFPPHRVPLECLDTRVAHLKCLVQFIDCDLKHVFELRRQIKDGSLKEIAFNDLWHLFSPGDIIITSPLLRAYRVFHTTGGRPRLSKPNLFEKKKIVSPFNINCFYIGYDWKTVGPIHETLRIYEYAGKKPVTELLVALDGKLMIEKVTVCPLKMLSIDDRRNKVSHLISRGKRLRSLKQGDHKYYCGKVGGEALSSPDDDDLRYPRRVPGVPIYNTRSFLDSNKEREFVESDVIIDNEFNFENKAIGLIDAIEYDSRETAENCVHYGLSNSEYVNERFSRDCRCSDIVTDHVVDNDRATRYKDDSHLLQSYDSRDELDDDYLMLLLPIVEAFMLEKKTWNLLSVDDIKDPKGRDVRKQADFTDLILPEGHEYLLKALVRAHPSTKLLTSEDHSKSGLAILLHGPKGTGKCLTVKALSSYFNRSLYTINKSDFGLSTWDAGRELATHFQRAKKWNCIVAIPDAENKFPRRKTPPDGDYSASGALLREIELFHGIVVLITDNKDDLDEQVVKDMNICLGSDFWSKEDTIKIWHKALRDHGIDESINDGYHQRAVLVEGAYSQWVEFIEGEYRMGKRWNGVEIDNYFDTAIAMAEYETESTQESGKAGIKPIHLSIAARVAGASVFSVL